ncbi:hypothetical protein [Brevibacterium ihuae]|uniref:hypothetical protein n=1 Tax=Brevibacterium ihuae TaxID=1631743 RepID=UPI0015E0DA10|nr:hypothetical protein [Brevibacterium ihuae]
MSLEPFVWIPFRNGPRAVIATTSTTLSPAGSSDKRACHAVGERRVDDIPEIGALTLQRSGPRRSRLRVAAHRLQSVCDSI